MLDSILKPGSNLILMLDDPPALDVDAEEAAGAFGAENVRIVGLGAENVEGEGCAGTGTSSFMFHS